jgi:HSP20 family molecular chaperone IbpA
VPRREIDKLTEEVHELFEELWRIPRFAGLRRGFRPPLDVFLTESPRELTVVLDLAGVSPDCVKIGATERHLLISGERARPRVEGQVFQQAEIEYGPFERQIALAEPVDPARSRATYDAGFLTIVLPIAEQTSGPVKVPIEVSTSS